MKKIGAIFAHPDDEVLGCGGTLNKYFKNGNDIHTLILSKGVTSRINYKKSSQNTLINQARKASKILGCKTLDFCDFPDNEMDKVSLLEIIKEIENFIEKFNLEVIFTHDYHDLNNDHKIVNKSVITACRPFVKNIKVLSCEVLSSSEVNFSNYSLFKPNTFVNIEDCLKKKMDAMNEYKHELMEWPHPRSLEGIKNQAYYRGSQSGLRAAEAFRVLIDVNKGNDLP